MTKDDAEFVATVLARAVEPGGLAAASLAAVLRAEAARINGRWPPGYGTNAYAARCHRLAAALEGWPSVPYRETVWVVAGVAAPGCEAYAAGVGEARTWRAEAWGVK